MDKREKKLLSKQYEKAEDLWKHSMDTSFLENSISLMLHDFGIEETLSQLKRQIAILEIYENG